jgi:type IV pilus assembly protein PilV
MKNLTKHHQTGASLIEVLVAVLILSIGMLALGGMLAYSVQMPKLAAYRSAATTLAASHIERMRANTEGFASGSYQETMTYNLNLPAVVACAYPACTATTMGAMDKDETNRAIRRELPMGGMRVTCNGACANLDGDIWVMWQEPTTFAAISTANTDECPDPAADPAFTPFTTPKPRCLHVRFKL